MLVAVSDWKTDTDVAEKPQLTLATEANLFFLHNLKETSTLFKTYFCCFSTKMQKEHSTGRPRGYVCISLLFCTSCDSFYYIAEASLYEVISPYLNLWETYKKKKQKHRRQMQVSLARQQLLCKEKVGGGLSCPTRRPCILQPKLHRHTFQGHVLNVETAERRGQKGSILPHRHHSCEKTAAPSLICANCPFFFFFYIIILTCYLSPG